MSPSPWWTTIYLDLAPEDHDVALGFWAGVTGYAVGQPRGRQSEFRTLLPPAGDPHLGLQRLDAGPSRLHLDLHVPTPRAAAAHAVACGAELVHESEDGFVVLGSPGGLVFCLVDHPGSASAPPASWAGGWSMVDQVCLDVPAAGYDDECAFWQQITGRELTASATRPEFRALPAPAGQPVRMLLQRLEQSGSTVAAHLDIASQHRAAETERHTALGASVVATEQWWTVLVDPTGSQYCITDRAPSGAPPRPAGGS